MPTELPPVSGAPLRGTVHGKIELERLPPAEGMRRAFGICTDEADELDAFLELTRQQRKLERREIGL